MGVVERNRLLPRVREGIGGHTVVKVTKARQTAVVHVYQKGKCIVIRNV
jgi:hypothetical protein